MDTAEIARTGRERARRLRAAAVRGWRAAREIEPPAGSKPAPAQPIGPPQPAIPSTPPEPGDRLVPSPVFLLSSPRSGSTLLRLMLDSHPDICAPHELHLVDLDVRPARTNGAKAMAELGLDDTSLANLLWDRVLHRELTRAGKSVVVDKTPRNVRQWRRIEQSWPEARYVVLLRHPARVLRSLRRQRPDVPDWRHLRNTRNYARRLHVAMTSLPCLVVRYEDLTADPHAVTRRICDYLGVPWVASMVDYADVEHGRLAFGIGDASAKIKSGVVVREEAPPGPDEIPDEIREVCELLGYL